MKISFSGLHWRHFPSLSGNVFYSLHSTVTLAGSRRTVFTYLPQSTVAMELPYVLFRQIVPHRCDYGSINNPNAQSPVNMEIYLKLHRKCSIKWCPSAPSTHFKHSASHSPHRDIKVMTLDKRMWRGPAYRPIYVYGPASGFAYGLYRYTPKCVATPLVEWALTTHRVSLPQSCGSVSVKRVLSPWMQSQCHLSCSSDKNEREVLYAQILWDTVTKLLVKPDMLKECPCPVGKSLQVVSARDPEIYFCVNVRHCRRS